MPSNPCAGRQWTEATRPFRALCAANNAPCALCQGRRGPIGYHLPPNDPLAFTVDHIIARWAGGSPLDPTNWQPAHRSCNSSRGAKETNAIRHQRPHPPYFRATELSW